MIKKLLKYFLRLFDTEIFNKVKIQNSKISEFKILKNNQSKLIKFTNKFLKGLNSNHIILRCEPEQAELIQPYIYSNNPDIKKFCNTVDYESIPVIVSGFGATGSSSVVHFLREHLGFIDPKPKGNTFEFRLIKDPGGLIDLRRSLKRNSYWNNYAYIQDYINQAKLNSRLSKKNLFTKIFWPNELKYQQGFALAKLTNGNFENYTNDFINDLIDVRHKFNWWNHYRNLSFYQELLEHLKNKKLESDSFLIKFKEFSKDEIDLIFSNYLDKIFKAIIDNYVKNFFWYDDKVIALKKKYLLVDQGVLPEEADETLEILPKETKVIIVSRDPRDVYLSSLSQNKLAYFFPNNVKDFCKIYANQYKQFLKQKNKNIFHVQFEKLIFENEKETERLEKFLGIKFLKNTKYDGKFFSLEWSKSRIGKWKNFGDKDTINYIKENFPNEMFYD